MWRICIILTLLLYHFPFLQHDFVCAFSADWYKGILTDEELHNLEFPKPKARPANKGPSRGKPQRQQQPVAEEEEE